MRRAPAVAHGPRDVGGAVDGVAGREDIWEVGLAGGGIRTQRPSVGGGQLAGEGARVGRHADGADDDLAGQDRFAAGDRLGTATTGRIRGAKGHPRTAQTAHRARRVAEDLGGGDLEAEGDAFAFRVIGFDVVGGHLLAPAPVGDGHRRRSEAAGGSRGVHRDVSPTDDDDTLVAEVHWLAELHPAQEVDAPDHAEAVLAGNAEVGGAMRAGGDQDRVEAVVVQGRDVPDGAAGRDLDADSSDVVDVALDHVDRETVGGDGEAQEATGLARRLEDLDRIALAR